MRKAIESMAFQAFGFLRVKPHDLIILGSCRKKSNRRLFARTAAETESLCSEKVEFFEAHKYNAARAVLNALKCIDRLSEVKDLPADLKQASSIDDLKNALQKIVDAEPQPEQKPEPEKKRKGAPRRVKKTDKTEKTDKTDK